MLRDNDLKLNLYDFNNDFFDFRYFTTTKNLCKIVTLLSSFVVVYNNSSAFLSSLPVVYNNSPVP